MAIMPLEQLTASVRARAMPPALAVLSQTLSQPEPEPSPTPGEIHYYNVLNTLLNLRATREMIEAGRERGEALRRLYEAASEDLRKRWADLSRQFASLRAGGAASYTGPRPPSSIASILQTASRATGIPLSILTAVARAESGFRPDAVSPAGAIGLMQLMPGTARALGVNPWDPLQNALGGARYLAQQLQRFGDLRLALAAYNAGPGRVQQAIRRAGSTNWSAIARYLPRETQNYVARVIGWLR